MSDRPEARPVDHAHVEVHHGTATHVGHVREANEDAALALPPVFVVADGMGGHDRGDVASAFVVEELARLAGRDHDVETGIAAIGGALVAAQTRIATHDAEQRAAGHDGFAAGTTVVVALLVEANDGPRWLLANVGDSRIYRHHEGVLEQVSVDHSVVQELIDAGALDPASAAAHPSRHVVTRALGGVAAHDGVSSEPDYFLLPLSATERLMLCSDGVSGMVADTDIAAILEAYDDPRDAADALIAAALEAGGRDNATALVVDVVGLAHVHPYDAAAQRVSLEQKLGALP